MKVMRNVLIGVTVCLVVVLVADMTFIGTAMTFLREGRMAYGLTAGTRPIGGMTRDEAAIEVKRAVETALAGDALVLSVVGEDRTYSFSAAEIGLSADVDAMIDAAYKTGREGSSPQQFFDAMKCAFAGREVLMAVKLDENRLAEALHRVKQEVDRAPKDASVVFSAAGIEHRPAVTGRQVDTEALAAAVKPRLLALQLPCREAIALEEKKPEVSLEDIQAIDGILSSCTTYYIADTGRGDNIEIATAALNNRIVRPGEELSFNAQVGSRVASKGYADAPVIVNGKVEQDIGGGVCQVSSTLYNAVLLAGLTPTARTAHFYPSAYISAGLDATVADGQIDFAFSNPLKHCVLLRAGASEGTLTVEIYGHRGDLPGEYDLETAVIGPPPTVEVYRVLYQGDTVIEREYLYTDVYDVPPPPEEEKKPNKPTEAAQSTPEPEPEPTASESTKPSAPEPKKPTQPSPVPSKPSTTDAAKPASDNRR